MDSRSLKGWECCHASSYHAPHHLKQSLTARPVQRHISDTIGVAIKGRKSRFSEVIEFNHSKVSGSRSHSKIIQNQNPISLRTRLRIIRKVMFSEYVRIRMLEDLRYSKALKFSKKKSESMTTLKTSDETIKKC